MADPDPRGRPLDGQHIGVQTKKIRQRHQRPAHAGGVENGRSDPSTDREAREGGALTDERRSASLNRTTT